MARQLPEWISANPDAMPPPRVRLRIFDAHGGICHISGRKIMPGEVWHLDHVKALILGGENRESNLRPVLVNYHKAKTAGEVAEKAKVDAIRKAHLGIKPKTQKIASRGFEKAPAKEPKQQLPPARLYEDE